MAAQFAQFFLDLVVLQRPLPRPVRGLHLALEQRAVLERDAHLHGVDRHAGIVAKAQPQAQCPQPGVGDRLVRKLGQPGAAAHQRHGHGMLGTDLRLPAGGDARPVGALFQQRMPGQFDALDGGPAAAGDAGIGRQRQAGVDHRIEHHAAGIRLVRVVQHLPAFAQAGADRSDIGRVGGHAQIAAHALQRLRRSVETLRRQQGRQQPVARRIAHADALGRGAQRFHLPACLHRRATQCRHHGVARQSQAARGAAPNTPQVDVICQPRA